ncbi:papilin isoform X8 [Pongo abelii]|uniref:papilin isoform X8 n=1 Tax=Pongo abelii TaxID=9601 RepID=UPI003006B6AD
MLISALAQVVGLHWRPCPPGLTAEQITATGTETEGAGHAPHWPGVVWRRLQKQAEMRLLLLVPLLLAPAPGSSAPKVRRQSDTWGPWGQWSPCSRTCGGGVSFRERPCYSQRRDGGSSCVGPARSHRSCRTESCPDGARDFRAEQCAEFDGAEFQGRRYRWLPYYGAPNKCELNCIPKGENFYYKHREAVVDGTPCEPGKRDVCVDGSCRVVGCDHELDSSKQEDKCLRCGGDGTTCYPVTGTFDANDLSRGYNQILIVPVGATSILIEEAAASRNFLAVKNVRGEYYLNGHWTIEAARALPAASTILHYERGAEGDLAPERLHARGPTSEPLVIEVTSPAWCSAPSTTKPTRTTCASTSHGQLTGAPATFTLAQRPSACSLEDRPPLTEPCVHEDCPLLSDQAWHVGTWGLCSKSCSSGTRRRQVVCAIGPPSHCGSLQHSKPVDVEPCNTQPCHLPQEVPSMQDVHTPASNPWMPLGPQESPASDSRGQWWAAQEHPSARGDHRGEQGDSRGDEGTHLSALGTAPSLQQPPYQQPLRSGSGPHDCRHSPHGCCPDGHTASLGPQWQGCPGAPCQQSRYGCCPDRVSVAEGPHHAGCTKSYGGDSTGGRPRSRAVASTVHNTHQPQAQQNEPSECRGSQFGCCYDNMATAAGPLGEGCVGQPSHAAYPVRCLLPSAHGSCTDWAARWYFVASVGQCNRFWYGGCHGNANNFASEQECMSSCQESLHGPRRPQPGASGRSTHTDDGGSSPAGEQEPSQHRTGAVVQRKPWPSGGLWRQDQQPGLGEAPHTHAFGEWPWGQELGSRAPGLGGDAGSLAPPFHSSSYRISLAGVEPSLVQAALGQSVRLSCSDDTAPESQAAWQKDGQPISSDRHRLQSDGSLIIHPLQAEDVGTYSCGSTRPGRNSQKIQLRIIGGDVAVLSQAELSRFPQPRDPAQDFGQAGAAGPLGAIPSSHPQPANRLRLDQNQPQVVDASPGQRIRMTCRAEGFPPPAIEWQRDGQPVSSPRHQLQPDGSLVISRVAVEDGGFYTCVAFNGQDQDQRWVQLRVLGELTISGLPPTVTVPEGDTARLSCVVAGESVNIRWSRNGLPVQADGHHVHQSPDGTLLIYNLRARDEGSYTCSAYQGSQAVSRSTEVKVVSPAPTAQPRDPGRDCVDQPELANCDLILQAQLCGNEYYSSFCCASCSRFQPHAQPIWQ